MPIFVPLRRALCRAAGPALLALALATAGLADPVPTSAEASQAPSKPSLGSPQLVLADFIDRLPDLLDLGLPSFAPPGAVHLYAHPHLGDFLHEDYFRLPVGARFKLNDTLELDTELAGYFTHGLRNSAGNGLYQFLIGLQREVVVTPDLGWSFGLQFVTPLSRPPISITDGLRHTMPNFTVTKTLDRAHGLIGFATLSADFISYTPLTVNYRENELRDNSLVFTVGVAREWRRMHVILRLFDGNTAPLSRHEQNVFGFRPSLGIPLLRRPDGTPRATVTFEGRTVWGPDGFEKGINTTVRVDLRYRHGHRASP